MRAGLAAVLIFSCCLAKAAKLQIETSLAHPSSCSIIKKRIQLWMARKQEFKIILRDLVRTDGLSSKDVSVLRALLKTSTLVRESWLGSKERIVITWDRSLYPDGSYVGELALEFPFLEGSYPLSQIADKSENVKFEIQSEYLRLTIDIDPIQRCLYKDSGYKAQIITPTGSIGLPIERTGEFELR